MFPGYQGGEEHQPGQQPPRVRGHQLQLGPGHLVLGGGEYHHIYSVSGLSCPEAEAYLTVIFHSFQHNNNINSDYILGEIMYFSPHGNFSSYF